MLMSYCIARSQ